MTTLTLRDPGLLAAAGGGGDPHFANVSLLLHGDGSNGSATIIDSSSSPKVLTVYSASISTSVVKYGTGSVLFNNPTGVLTTNQWITATSNGFAFGTGPFTVEAWVYLLTLRNYMGLLSTRSSPAGDINAWYLGCSGTGALVWYDSTFMAQSAAGVLTTNQWMHVAGTREGNSLRLFVNGALVVSNSNYTRNTTKTLLGIGALGNGAEATYGYMDEVRITKGIARYTADFTPPAAPFPDF